MLRTDKIKGKILSWISYHATLSSILLTYIHLLPPVIKLEEFSVVCLVVKAKCEHSISEAFRFLNPELTGNNEKTHIRSYLLRSQYCTHGVPLGISLTWIHLFLYLCVVFVCLFQLDTIFFFLIISYHRQIWKYIVVNHV